MKKRIKNKHIIHFVEGGYYYCNTAVEPTPEKSTEDFTKVTCKNCLLKSWNDTMVKG